MLAVERACPLTTIVRRACRWTLPVAALALAVFVVSARGWGSIAGPSSGLAYAADGDGRGAIVSVDLGGRAWLLGIERAMHMSAGIRPTAGRSEVATSPSTSPTVGRRSTWLRRWWPWACLAHHSCYGAACPRWGTRPLGRGAGGRRRAAQRRPRALPCAGAGRTGRRRVAPHRRSMGRWVTCVCGRGLVGARTNAPPGPPRLR